MTRRVEVIRIHVPLDAPFDYSVAKAEIDDAMARGDDVSVEGHDIVVRTKVFLRGRAA